MTLQKCGIAALVLTMAGAGTQAGTSVTCELKALSGAAWIPGRISVHFSDDFSSAMVEDTAFSVFAPAKVVQRSETSFALTWSLPGMAVVPEGGRPEPRFRAVLNTANQKMSIQAAGGEDGAKLPRGAGSCQREGNLSMLAEKLVGEE